MTKAALWEDGGSGDCGSGPLCVCVRAHTCVHACVSGVDFIKSTCLPPPAGCRGQEAFLAENWASLHRLLKSALCFFMQELQPNKMLKHKS